jgi:hypothetical membrane protein
MRFLALGGVAGPVLFVLVTAASGMWQAEYSHLHQFISELGASGTPHAWLMNYVGFVPTGLLFLGFAVSTRSIGPRTLLSAIATLLLVFFAVGATVAGMAPCDVGCPQGSGSLANMVHDQISPLAFLALILAAALFGFYFRSVEDWRPYWMYSVATSGVSFGLMTMLVLSLESRNFTGLWQRLLLVALFSWCAMIGLRLYLILRRIESTGEDHPTAVTQ